MADYRVPDVANEHASTALAGFAGTLVVFALAGGAGYALRRRGSGQRTAHSAQQSLEHREWQSG
jgi:hypothetical protein